MVQSPLIAMVSFTGSTAIDRTVGTTAARSKRVSLVSGWEQCPGRSRRHRPRLREWRLHHGQVCMTAGRHIVLAGGATPAKTSRPTPLTIELVGQQQS